MRAEVFRVIDLESCFYIQAPTVPQQQLYFREPFSEGATDSNEILDWCIFTEMHPEAVEMFGSFKESPSSLYTHSYIKLTSAYETPAQDFTATSKGETGLRGTKF